MALGISSCHKDSSRVEIHRLDRQLPAGIMPEDSLSLKAADVLFEISGYGGLGPITLDDYRYKPSIREHVKGVEGVFPDMELEEKSLGEVFAEMSFILPNFTQPEVFTVISPFTQSVLVVDSMIFIGLNHYLGEDYIFYEYFPDYMRRLKTRDRIPVDVAEALIRTSYPYRPTDDYPRVVSRLAYEGAVTEAVMKVTGMDERTVLGHTREDYDWLRKNEAGIWNTLLEKQLLFSTNRSVERSLVGHAPKTTLISTDAPGRTGRFIGHKLVKSFIKNNKAATIDQLLTSDFYESPTLLKDAGYNPD